MRNLSNRMKPVKAWALVDDARGTMSLHAGQCPVYWNRSVAKLDRDYGERIARVLITEVPGTRRFLPLLHWKGVALAELKRCESAVKRSSECVHLDCDDYGCDPDCVKLTTLLANLTAALKGDQ